MRPPCSHKTATRHRFPVLWSIGCSEPRGISSSGSCGDRENTVKHGLGRTWQRLGPREGKSWDGTRKRQIQRYACVAGHDRWKANCMGLFRHAYT